MADEFSTQLEKAVGVDVLLDGSEIEDQAKELRKLLIVSGIDLESDLSNPEIMDIISKTLKNFDVSHVD